MKYQAIDSDYIREMKERDEFLKQKNMMYKGLKYGYYTAIIIIILSAFFSGNLVLAQTSNIDYDFENVYAYNGVLPDKSELINMRNTTEPTGHYPATYSFVGETGLTSTAISFIDSETSYDGGSEVIANLNGHIEVLAFEDDITGGEHPTAVHNMSQRDNGIIEFWFSTTNTANYPIMSLKEGATTIERIRVAGGELWYTNSGSTWVSIDSFVADTWYHFKMIWEADNTWDFYVDFNLEVDNQAVENNQVSGINAFDIYQGGDSANILHIDAFGESWSKTSLGEHNLTAMDIFDDWGTIIDGDIDDANIDDANYFSIASVEDVGGEENIIADFIFGSNLPADSLTISYHMESNTSQTVNLEADGVMFVAGTTIDDDDVELFKNVFLITLYTTALVDPFHIKIFYIHIETLDNYTIGSNIISTYNTTNNLETDRFEFAYDSSGNMNSNGDDDVSGFTDIENDFWSVDVVNVHDSDDAIDKSIRITSAQKGNCGIYRDFNTDDVLFAQIDWELDLNEMGYPICEIYTKIENNDSGIIAIFMLNGSYVPYGAFTKLADLSYYNGSEWVLLDSGIQTWDNYNMTFSFNWTNGDNSGILGFDGDNYYIPFENDQDSLGNIEIYGINDHNTVFNMLDFEIDWIRVIINGTSLSDELMPENVYILTGNDFSLLYQSFIEITVDITYENNISIFLNDDVEIINYGDNLTADRVSFGNFYQDKSYSGLFFKIYNSSVFKIDNIKVYGIQLINQQDPTDNPFLEFDYSNVDPNISYFYVSSNDLYYHLETDDNGNLEYIQATFNINDFTTEGYAVAFTHQKGTTYLQSECGVAFTDNTYLSFLSSNTTQAEGLIMPQEKTVKEIVFLITDDNNGIIDTSDGYFSEISFIFYPDIATTITTLSLIEVLPIIILLTSVPIAIYYGFGKKKELIVPSLALMSIFATGVGLIPIWLEVVIIFSCVAYYVIQQKRGGI